jgi:hypothetical protein
VLAALGVLAGIFFARKSVVIVTDTAFESLYGTKRALTSRVVNSLRLFRPVRVMTIPSGAGSDQIASAAVHTSSRPLCIVFPYRYEEAAERCAAELSQLKVTAAVFTLGSRFQTSANTGASRFIQSDPLVDMYRAGLFAGIIYESGKILVLESPAIPAAARESFELGVKAGAAGKENVDAPVFQGAAQNAASTNLACVLIAGGPASAFLGNNAQAHVMLFSWLDPAFTPQDVFAVFDDSHWALLPGIVRTALSPDTKLQTPDGGSAAGINGSSHSGITLSSKITIMGERIATRKLVRALAKAAARNLPQ